MPQHFDKNDSKLLDVKTSHVRYLGNWIFIFGHIPTRNLRTTVYAWTPGVNVFANFLSRTYRIKSIYAMAHYEWNVYYLLPYLCHNSFAVLIIHLNERMSNDIWIERCVWKISANVLWITINFGHWLWNKQKSFC